MRSAFGVRPEARRRTAGFGWVRAWLPAVVACGVIAMESTQTMGASHTSGWLRPIFEKIFGVFRDQNWDLLHHVIRKSGHFIGYGLVCLAFLRGWLLTLARRAEFSTAGWRLRSCVLAVGCTFVVASCDEFHQTFVPGRGGLFSDVLLDTCGATVMCLLVWVVFRWWRADAAGTADATGASAGMQEG